MMMIDVLSVLSLTNTHTHVMTHTRHDTYVIVQSNYLTILFSSQMISSEADLSVQYIFSKDEGKAPPWSSGSVLDHSSNLGVSISEGCFIFHFASLLLEVARPIWPTMCTKVAVKHQSSLSKDG